MLIAENSDKTSINFVAAMTIMQTGSSSTSHTNLLKVERPYYEQEQFNNDLKYCKPDVQTPSFCNRVTNLRFSKILMQLFPVFSWLPNYNVKHDLIGDVVSGCTVAVMHIPQGKTFNYVFIYFIMNFL